MKLGLKYFPGLGEQKIRKLTGWSDRLDPRQKPPAMLRLMRIRREMSTSER